jgi:hypothetical protein
MDLLTPSYESRGPEAKKGEETLAYKMVFKFLYYLHIYGNIWKIRGRIFSQTENKLGAGSFPVRNKVCNGFPLYLFTIWERFQND